MVNLIIGGAGALGTQLRIIYTNAFPPTQKELEVGNKNEVCEFFKKNDIDFVIQGGR